VRYMLLITAAHGEDEDDEPGTALPPGEPCWAPWARHMDDIGVVLVDGARLGPVTGATTVRARGGQVLLSDGPFAETKEQIAGYQVIECADLDAAIEAAASHPIGRHGSVEVRPVLEG
jgi:hypothetical protein